MYTSIQFELNAADITRDVFFKNDLFVLKTRTKNQKGNHRF